MSRFKMGLVSGGILAAGAVLLLLAGVFLDWGPMSPAKWEHVDGRVATNREWQGDDVPNLRAGPEHCEWQTALFLSYRRGVFVYDPGGILDRSLMTTRFGMDVAMPPDARPTVWRYRARELWVDESDRDERSYRSVYVKEGRRVQRWPRFDGGCD